MGPFDEVEIDAEYTDDLDVMGDAPDAGETLETLRSRILSGPFVSPEARRLFGGVTGADRA